LKCISSAPIGSSGATDHFTVAVTASSQSSMFLTSAGQTSQFSVFVNRITNPIDFGVSSDRFMERIHTNHFKVFESRVLSHPIRAQNAESFGHSSADPLFGDRLMVAAGLQFIDAMILGLTISGTFGHLLLAPTSSYAYSIDDKSLFGSEAESSGLLWSCGSRTSVDNIELSVLPTPQTQQKPHNI